MGIITGSYLDFADEISGGSFVIDNLNLYASQSAYITQNLYVTGTIFGTTTTASYVNPLTQSVFISGSLIVNGPISASVLNVSIITSSVTTYTGSTIFGSSSSDTHQFTGSILTTGSIYVTGSIFTKGNIYVSGTLFGTSSYALNALSSSYSITSSYTKTASLATIANNVNYSYGLADDFIYTDANPFVVSNLTPYNIYVSQSVTSSNVLKLTFNEGNDGQIVNFTPVWEAYDLNLMRIDLVAGTVYIYGLGGKVFPSGSITGSLANVFIGTGSINNLTFQYLASSLKASYNPGWYLINKNTI